GRSQTKREYKTSDEGSFTSGKLVILVDESSASASEIVSGAVQDWDRGVIVGRRSYGKGLVQESFILKDRSAIRLTIARYYTPTGRSIQKPYDQGYDEYETEIDHRFSSGELDNPDSIKKNEKLAYKTPSGRKVYGGGGIYPDVFVPLDSALHNQLATTVFRNGFISRLAYNYVDRHRKRLKKLGSLETFSKQFSFEGELKAGLEKLLADSKITYTGDEFKGALPLFASQTKALIARQVYGKNAYYQVLNETDNTFEMALESLKDYEAILKGESSLAWYNK
ncbi:MAG TPA: S41 family peptidase, partial [Bacteroidia bacterium]|nr:S41 family peptidase [Bacteroidia bacterium]